MWDKCSTDFKAIYSRFFDVVGLWDNFAHFLIRETFFTCTFLCAFFACTFSHLHFYINPIYVCIRGECPTVPHWLYIGIYQPFFSPTICGKKSHTLGFLQQCNIIIERILLFFTDEKYHTLCQYPVKPPSSCVVSTSALDKVV